MTELDPTHRSILERELADAEKEHTRLGTVVSYLRDRLGLPAEPDAAGGETHPVPNGLQQATVTGNVVSAVNPMQFFGLSANKAAKEVLEMVGKSRPLTTREVYDAITKGGIEIKDTEILGKMMKKSPMFQRVGEGRAGRWGLVEWYGGSASKRKASQGDLSDDADDSSLGDDLVNEDGSFNFDAATEAGDSG